MASQLETTSGLERRLTLSVSQEDLAKKVQNRLRTIARTARMPGFRPGKVPMRMIEQAHGASVYADEIGNAVTEAFSSAVREHDLRVAGQPRIDPVERAADGGEAEGAGPEFTATFEVYPDVTVGDPTALSVSRFTAEVGEAEIDRTIDVLRRQRTEWKAVERASQDGDRVRIDFRGMLEGEAFEGGSAEGFETVVGAGRMLPDFEAALKNHASGEEVTFDVAFPSDYNAEKLAGRTASFTVRFHEVAEPVLPEVDEAFIRAMGVEKGSVDEFRADVRQNLEREVRQRIRARNKASVMDEIVKLAEIDLPKSLVEQEAGMLAERMKEDFKAQGMDVARMNLPNDAFRPQAERRVRLGLIVAEIVQSNQLTAKPDQIKAQIEEFSQAYDNPAELVRWYYSDRNRLAEVEALVVEQNVVDWVVGKAQVTDQALTFDELMQNPQNGQPTGGQA